MWINKNLLTHEQKQQITILRNSPNNIVGLSGGKDSAATCIILAELDIPFKTVTAEVWWKEGITGENPYHFEFLHEKLIPTLERWGVTCDFVRSDVTAYDYMTTPIQYTKNHPERVGKYRGFPICGACGIQRDCKTRPCEKYYKAQGDYNAILGFASNEKDRVLSGQRRGQISILSLFINDYDFDETLEYHISETQERFDTDLKVYPEEDCFSTREEAERALKGEDDEKAD